jgi:ATP-dependent exoDNAse (exonuclease V) alpha subunit
LVKPGHGDSVESKGTPSGDIIISRHNDATLTVEPGQQHRRGERIDQVRNGNRWRVVGVDATQGRIAAERLIDQARVIFEGDHLREHITLGYVGTVHSAQGMTIGNSTTPGVCWSILSDRASRAMAYVGMTRGRERKPPRHLSGCHQRSPPTPARR